MTGATSTTGADGTASVGGWTLGGIGVNALSATVDGATFAGNPVSFAATADEVLLQPSQDTTLSGTVSVTRFVLPAGRTVTATADLTILADSTVQIDGTLTGACVAISVKGKQLVTGTGTIDNSCATDDDNSPGLLIFGAGGYSLTGADVTSSGDIMITNDTTLTDASFPDVGGIAGRARRSVAARSSAAAARSSAAVAGLPICAIAGGSYHYKHPRARDGANGVSGGPGLDGHNATIICLGDMVVLGGATITAQGGGNGGSGTDLPARPADAHGNYGGVGGDVRLFATGVLSLDGPVLTAGSGGTGGDALAQGLRDAPGDQASDATAHGGTGGSGGVVDLRSYVEVEFESLTQVHIGKGGNGGDATAKAADGTRKGSARWQDGGNATAVGGRGGSSRDKILRTPGVLNPGLALVLDGEAGNGGTADAFSGYGANGDPTMHDAGRGGNATATAGDGGDALLRDTQGNFIANGGSGGIAILRGGNGGNGQDGCSVVAPLTAGGMGGKGGNASGSDGTGGTGKSTGPNGGVTIDDFGNAGLSAMGTPPGFSVQGGTNTVVAHGNLTLTGTNFSSTSYTLACFKPNLLSWTATVTRSGGGPPFPACNPLQNNGNFQITNNSTQPIEIQTTWTGPPTTTLQGGNLTLAPGAQTTVTIFWDCTDATGFSASILVKGTLAGAEYTYTIPVTLTIN